MSYALKVSQGKEVTNDADPFELENTERTRLEISTHPKSLAARTLIVNSTRTIYGFAKPVPGEVQVPETSAVWQIYAVDTQGSGTHRHYAVKDGSENPLAVHKWSEAETLFPAEDFFNDYSTRLAGLGEHLNGGDINQFDVANQFTYIIWIKPDNLSAQRCLLSKATNDLNVYGIGLYHTAASKLLWQMRAPGFLRQHTGAINLTTDWQMIAVTFNGSSNINGSTLYVNAVADTTPASGSLGASILSGQDFLVGRRGSSFNFSGYVDEISVWQKSLSAGEVAQVYNGGSPIDVRTLSFAGDLVHFYRCGDNDSEPVVLDNEGSDNLAMVNGPTFEQEVP